MKRKLLIMLLAGILTLQSAMPVLAEETAEAQDSVAEIITEKLEEAADTGKRELENDLGSESSAGITSTESEAVGTEPITEQTEISVKPETTAEFAEEETSEPVPGGETEEEEIIITPEDPAEENEEDLFEKEMVNPNTGLAVAAAGSVAITAQNFPDPTFRELVAWGCDQDKDGILSAQEIANVDGMSLNIWAEIFYGYKEVEIKDLTGVEYLTNLKSLKCYTDPFTYLKSELTSLDISKNTKLESLDCFGNNLTTLDISNNPNLLYLECGKNHLTNLDVSKNPKLLEVKCQENDLTSLNLKNNTKLTCLRCSKNNLTNIDLSANPELTELLCEGNHLTKLDLKQNTKLRSNYFYSVDNVIEVYAARVNNTWKIYIGNLVGQQDLKNVSIIPPKGQETACTYLTGSGIMTIATDNLPTEVGYQYDTGLDLNGERQYLTVTLKLKNCTSHKFGEYVTTKQPTYTTEGLAVRTCSVCGTQESKTLPKLTQKATVSFSTDSLTLQVGKSVSLKKYVTGMQKGDSISRWNSFAANIASVDANGNVTAKRAGKAYIAVGTKEGAVAKILITVQDSTVHTTGISGLHTGIALEVGKTVTLRPVITPANSQDPVQYASVAPNIVTVSANGVVKGIRAGSAYVYVKSGTKYVKILVKVTAGSLTAITGVRTTGSLYVGASYQLRPQRYPAGSAGVFYYKSTDPSVAVVDKNGKIIAKKKGITVITVTARNVSTTMRLTVK